MHLKNLSGRFSPKKTMSGFTNPPHSSHLGISSLNISSLIHCWENSFLHLIQWPVWKAPWASTILGKGSFGRKSIYYVYCELKLFFQHYSIIQEELKLFLNDLNPYHHWHQPLSPECQCSEWSVSATFLSAPEAWWSGGSELDQMTPDTAPWPVWRKVEGSLESIWCRILM